MTETKAAVSVLTVHDMARDEINRMSLHVEKMYAYYGASHEWSRRADGSLRRALATLFGWGDLNVYRDGDLSLLCQSGSLTFGLIFHPVRRHCVREGCDMYANDDYTTWSYRRVDERTDCGDHEWLYPVDAPTPGDWSYHS
jgi:hypothetical protein